MRFPARSAVAAALTALVVAVAGASPAAADVFVSRFNGGPSVGTSDVRPLTFDNVALGGTQQPPRTVFEVDQRTLGFNERVLVTLPVRSRRTTVVCGVLTLSVVRYQTYELRWSSGNRGSARQLYRGNLIRDAARPYVGVFLRSNGDLVIQTYNRLPPVGGQPGALTTTPFVAASFGSGGRGVTSLRIERDGFTLRDRAGAAVTAGTGPSGCTDDDF